MSEAKKPINPQIAEHLTIVKQKERIRLRDAEVRNIVFVGRTRTGKSTALKVLRSPTFIAKPASLYSETEDTTLFSFTVEVKGDKPTSYTLNFIDTPGLFEVTRAEGESRTNEVIKATIAKCLEYEITKIHAVFFVCSYKDGLNIQDVETFKQFISFFSGGDDTVAMLVTNTEDWTEEQKIQRLDQIYKIPQMSDVLQLVKDRIFFLGALVDEAIEEETEARVKTKVHNIIRMRRKLYDWIFTKSHHCVISGLSFYALQKNKAELCLEEIHILIQQGYKTHRDNEEFTDLTKQLEKKVQELKLLAGFAEKKKMEGLLRQAEILCGRKWG